MNSRDDGPLAGALLTFAYVSLGLIVGGAVGLAAGIGIPMAIAALTVWMTGDPTRTAAGFLIFITAPMGLLLGAIWGAALAVVWRRGREP